MSGAARWLFLRLSLSYPAIQDSPIDYALKFERPHIPPMRSWHGDKLPNNINNRKKAYGGKPIEHSD